MSEVLRRARCVVHPEREASARCLACQRYYCRECVTGHGGRLLCARCIGRLEAPTAARRHDTRRWLLTLAGLAGGTFAAWLFFAALGELLLVLPGGLRESSVTRVEQ